MRTPNGGFPSAPLRTLAVTLAAFGFLLASGPSAPAGDPDRGGLAQSSRKQSHSRPPVRQAGDHPDPAASPQAKPPLEEPASPARRPSEQADKPDEDDEVSPGDSPASCEGCELAGFILAGSMWGLFGVSRRRGVPRTYIRGLQVR